MTSRITPEIYDAMSKDAGYVVFACERLKNDAKRLNLLLWVEHEIFHLESLKKETLYVGKSFSEVRAYVDGYEAGHSAAGPGM